MLRKPPIPMALLLPITPQATWAHSSWERPLARSLPMAVAIGGHHTVMKVFITPTQRRSPARIMATVITMARLITTIVPEPMAGMGVLMVRTDQHTGALVIILIPVHTQEAVRFRLLMEAEVLRKHTIHIPALMRRRDKVQVPPPSGAVRTFREETRALPLAIIPPPMERWPALQPRRAARRWGRIPHGEIRQLAKLPAVTCMPNMTGMFTRTLGMVGKSTTTAVGTR